MDFNVGDKVTPYLDGRFPMFEGHGLTRGRAYEVLCTEQSGPRGILLWIRDDTENIRVYNSRLFQLHE